MGLMDELKRLARPYADDEEYDEEYEDELDDELEEPEEAPAPAPAPSRPARSAAKQQEAPAARSAAARPVSGGMGASSVSGIGGLGNVVNLHSGANLQVILVKPDRYENVSEVADHIRNKCAVVLNLESTNKDTARRLVDFLSGCAYALDGKIKKVALSTYLITPFGVEIVGDLKDEIESAAAYY